MNFVKLRNRMAGAASLGVAAAAAALMLGGGVASASPPSDPPGGATPVYPHFYNGNVEGIRDTGSDTTFFMMQKIGDLYTAAGLYGCALNGTATQTLYNSTDGSSSSSNFEDYCQKNANVDTTDVSDNWDRTEVTEGVDDVGSGAGQNQLCNAEGSLVLNSPLPVDFARSSKPPANACTNQVGTGYAKDGVPIIDFPSVNPSSYGTSTFASGVSGAGSNGVSYASVNGGLIGDVANGWLPGDPTSTSTVLGSGFTYASTNHGTPYSSGKTTDSLSDVSTPDVVYGIWCTGTINDWGQLTNLGGPGTGGNPKLLAIVGVTVANTGPGGDAVLTLPASATTSFPVTTFPSQIASPGTASGADIASGSTVSSGAGTNTITLSKPATTTGGPTTVDFVTSSNFAPGNGVPIGLPIRAVGVNTASGTEATFQGYADFGGLTGCSSQVPATGEVMVDPNGSTNSGDNSGGHTALENDAAQIGDFDAADFPNDPTDQAIELATTLYFESNGVYDSNPHAGVSPITSTGVNVANCGSGCSITNFAGNEVNENNQKPTDPTLLGNTYPTARTLFNIYLSNEVRASTAGFLNWTCDSNADFSKSTDTTTGANYDQELSTIIGSYDFIRLSDQSSETTGTPDTGLAAPNGSCGVEATGSLSGSTITITDASGWKNGLSAAPSQLVAGIGVVDENNDAGLPSGETISNVTDSGGTTTITLSQPDTADNATDVFTFGLPPVLSVPAAGAQS